jgi:hypothetical protein
MAAAAAASARVRDLERQVAALTLRVRGSAAVAGREARCWRALQAAGPG